MVKNCLIKKNYLVGIKLNHRVQINDSRVTQGPSSFRGTA